MERIRILLADDHALVRQGIRGLLETQPDFEVVGEASTGAEAVARARELLPDVILMDINMPGGGGIEATRVIKTEMPVTKILMLTVSEESQDLFDALKNGAQGYLLKNLKAEVLFENVRDVFRGEAPISSAMAAKILNDFSGRGAAPAYDRGACLTSREREVLQLVGEGLTNREIAKKLYIAENTVKIHLRNIMEKLHLGNRVQAAAYAIREGLTRGPG